MKTTLSQLSKGAGAALMLAALASCGGAGPGGTTTTTGTTGTGSTGNATPVYALGNGSGTSFKGSSLSVANSSLAAGGSTTITVSLVNTAANNALVTSSAVNVTFTSTCANNGSGSPLAIISPAAQSTGTSGVVTTTYTAKGCTSDNVTATAVGPDGKTVTASGSITIAAPVPVPELGNGFGTAFVNSVLAVQVPTLSAGGTTNITANIVDANNSNALYTQSVTVNFSSPCVSQGLATITSSVTTSNGTAIATYTAKGCSGADTVTASATAGSASLSAAGVVTVQPPVIGSIQFISASPTKIFLAGSGGVSSSKVTFQVNDANGNPVPNVTVTFTLQTTAGGVTLSPTSATTGSNGQASTFVQAGQEIGAASVKATVTGPSGPLSTGSNSLSINTGVGTENNFTVAPLTLNVQAWDHVGVTDKITVIVSDRFNNPVPDGTAISFTTNAGQIQGNCLTAGGTCNVTWTSANPRADGPPTYPLSVRGHVEILAFTIGEESFTDSNGNGIFDNGDGFTAYSGSGPGDSFLGTGLPGQNDIGEIYMDQTESGSYQSGDYFFDFNQDGIRNAPDHLFYGADCVGNGTTSCGTTNTKGIGKQICIAETSDGAIISTSIDGGAATTAPNVTLSMGGTAHSITFTVTDTNGQSPVSGTNVALVQTAVANVTVTTPTLPFTFADSGCGSTGQSFTVFLIPGTGTGTAGQLQLTSTTPSPSLKTGGTVINITP